MFPFSASFIKVHSTNTKTVHRVLTLSWHTICANGEPLLLNNDTNFFFGCVHSACEFRTYLSVYLRYFLSCFRRPYSINLIVSASALPLFSMWTFCRFWNIFASEQQWFLFFFCMSWPYKHFLSFYIKYALFTKA